MANKLPGGVKVTPIPSQGDNSKRPFSAYCVTCAAREDLHQLKERPMSNEIRTITVKINADTTAFDKAVAGLKPSDYQIRLTALDRAMGRDAVHNGETDVIKHAHKIERYLRGDTAPAD